MISTLHIQNFQSHKSSELNLDKGINIIIGSSDSGKSALIRALNWIINNRPSGDSFRSHWAEDKETIVAIDIKDNIHVEKIKSNKINEYNFEINKEDNQQFKAFGQDVPEPIKKLLNFNEINFQYQMDSPFLLSSTAGEVAKYLNQIVNLESIDIALAKTEESKRTLNKKIKFKIEDTEKKQEQLKQYDYLEELEESIQNLEIKYKEFSTLKENYSELSTTIKQIESIQQEIKESKKDLPTEKEIDSLIKKIESLEKKEEEHEDLFDKIKAIETFQRVIKEKEKEISNEKEVLSLIKKIEEKEKLETDYKKLKNKIDNIENIQRELNIKEKKVSLLEKTYSEQMPSTCPLCDQEIKNGRARKDN